MSKCFIFIVCLKKYDFSNITLKIVLILNCDNNVYIVLCRNPLFSSSQLVKNYTLNFAKLVRRSRNSFHFDS